MPDFGSICRKEIGQLLQDFEGAPSRAGFFDVGAVAEIILLIDSEPGLKPLVQPVCDAAARWLKSGFLEDVCFSRVEFVYHAALLTCLARHGTGFCSQDMVTIKRLCENRLVGRSEMPALGQKLIAACFSRCGIRMERDGLGRTNLATMIDKRVLRARSDEYDILTLILCAQLHHLEPQAGHARPSMFPHVLLTEAIRSGNVNWLVLVAFLCAGCFGLPEPFENAVRHTVLESLPAHPALLPLPADSGSTSEYIERAGRGLRIRSTVALTSLLSLLGDSYADERVAVVVG